MTILVALSVRVIALGPAAKAATLLSPEPAHNGRFVPLQYAVQPEQRSQMIVTVNSPDGGPHIDVYAADRTWSAFRQIGTIFDPQFGTGLCCSTL